MPHRHAPSSCPIVMSHRHTTSSHTRGHVPSSHTRGHAPSSSPIVRPHQHTLLRIVMSRRHIPSSLPPPPPIPMSHRHRVSSCVIFIPYRHTLYACPMIMSNCRIPSVCPTVIPIATSIVKSHRHTSFWHPIVILHRRTHRHIVTPIATSSHPSCVLSFVSVSLC